MKIGLREIAKEAGVSLSLASQVLNRRDVRVAPETRQKILDVAERHHYVPNHLAASLKKSRTNTLAVLVPFTSVGFFSELCFQVEAYALERGFNTLVINTFGDVENEEKALRLFRSRMADGFLVAPQRPEVHTNIFNQMKGAGFPFVFIDRKVDGVDAVAVSSDHFKTARELTQWLIARNKRRILFLTRTNEGESSTIRSRRTAYIETMKEAGLDPIVAGFTHGEEGSSIEESIAQSGVPTPDALFVASGYYVPGVLAACVELGLDLASMDFVTVDHFMVPFDFLRKNTLVQWGRTNIRVAVQDVPGIAQQAVHRLLTLIDEGLVEGEECFVPVSIKDL